MTTRKASKKSPAKRASPAKKAAAKKAPAKKATSAKKAPAKKAALDVRPAPPPTVGAAAPSFSLPADDGRTVGLEELRGKHVVLYFYPKDDTPGCTKEACSFRDAAADLDKKGIVVLGVSRDSAQAHQKFKAKYKLPFTLLSDPEAKTIAAYGSWGPKKFMGRAFDGILRTTVVIDPQGKVKKVYPKVSVATHARDILADLEG